MNEELVKLSSIGSHESGSISSVESFKKESWPNTPIMNGGGHMLTLSPSAGDPAGTQQEPMQGSSSAGSNDLSKEESEGVWSMDIDQAFQEALEIYPPCGRRKIIISDEGKMYGRNELIARYIKLRCGKTRTRKQVSSHIQVLARKKMRDDQAKKKGDGMPSVTSPAMSSSVSPVAPIVAASTAIPLKPSPIPVSEVKPLLVQQTPQAPPRVPMPAMNPAQFSSISSLPTGPTLPLSDDTKDQFALNATNAFLGKAPMFPMPPGFNLFANSIMNPAFGDIKSFVDFQKFGVPDFGQFGLPTMICPQPVPSEVDVKPMATTKKLTMHDFTAYVEVDDKRTAMVSISEIPEVMEPISLDEIQDKFPESLRDTLTQSPSASFYVAKCWANLRFDIPCKDRALFAVDSNYSAKENFEIAVRTQVLSFGKIAIEKVEDFQADDCEDGVYRFSMMNSPMCDFMVTFICNLKTLEDCAQMNAVLENFTILQEVKNKKTDETLMILCFILQIDEDDGCGSQLLRLVP